MKNLYNTLVALILTLFIFFAAGFGFASNEHHDEHAEEHQGEHEDHPKGDENGHHGHGSGKAIGEGKAIVEVDEVKGFRLSKEAIRTLGIHLQPLTHKKFRIDKDTLVTTNDQSGVYRLRASFFKLLPVKILKEDDNGFLVQMKSIQPGDQIAVKGLGLLRVSDIYSTDEAEYGHGH